MTAAVPDLTTEQSLAISTRTVSVALSAGAGCGKTFVLTERYLSYFGPGNLQPAELGRLVAITFTDRAAREMRDRIRKKCFDRLLAASEAADADYWTALLRGLDGARVSTIHSFCGALLRTHAVEAGVDPRFAVLDQTQADALLGELLDDLLRALLADQDEDTLGLIVQFSLDRVRQMLRSLVRRGDAEEFARWLECQPAEQVEIWREYHRQVAVPAVLGRIGRSADARAILSVLADNIPSHPTMQQRRLALLAELTVLRDEPATIADPTAALETIRENAKVQGGGTKKNWDSEDAYDTFKCAAERLRKLIDTQAKVLTFDSAAALPAAVAGQKLLRLATRLATAYVERKQALGMLDYDDLLSRARRLLCDPDHGDLRQQLSAGMELLLVDEFQDTDPTQVELVSALCGEHLQAGKLFFVGDHKQSIYRFRGADPSVFHQLRARTPAAGQLPLTLNFRSQPAILNFVNMLFRHELGDNYEPLRAHRPQVSPLPAIELLWAPSPAGQKENKDAQREREADWIARRLKGMLDRRESIVWDAAAASAGEPATRPLELGDIAILFRALSDVQYYEAALRKYGLDYYLVGGHAFYAQQEIFDVTNLLKSLSSTADSVSLAGVLRSPMFALTDETLLWLAQHAGGLCAGVFASNLPEQLDEAQRQRVRAAAHTISELRERKDRLPIADLINLALARTGYDAVLLTEFMGERKLANLRKLIAQARSFDRAGVLSLADFINQLSDFVIEQPDEALAATHPEATNVVRLMSIHQSKGLEFPLVVVPDLNRAGNPPGSSVAYTSALGPLVKLPDDDSDDKTKKTIGGFELHATVAADEDAAERNRLLYVATTRAADYLILSSGIEDFRKLPGKWMQLLARHIDLQTGRISDCDRDMADACPIRVTMEEPQLDSAKTHAHARRDLGELVSKTQQLSATGHGQIAPLAERVAVDESARRQYSFSRLSGALHRESIVEAGGYADAEGSARPRIDPLGLGTLVHAVLEHVPLDELQQGGGAAVEAAVARHAREHAAWPLEAAAATEMLRRFQATDLARRIAKAKASYSELEFMLAWPPDAPTEGGIYLSGYIDRLWQDAGGWHVVDFKTNQVTAANLTETAAKYELQMLVYGLAVEKIFGVAPASLTLHFLRTGQEHVFVWDGTARRRVAELIGGGVASG